MTKERYLSALEAGYRLFREHRESEDEEYSRLEFLSDHVFDFTTYDSEISECFALYALKVCSAINNKTTRELIKDEQDYKWYLIMCNMPFFQGKLSWGSSIRYPWWSDDTRPIKFDGYGLCESGQQMGEMEFTTEEWSEFIEAIIAFAAKSPPVTVRGF
jgi:hypothetical protein